MVKKINKFNKKSLENFSLKKEKTAIFLEDSGKSLWIENNEWDLEVLGNLLSEAIDGNYQDSQKIIVSYEGMENEGYTIGLKKTKTLGELKNYFPWFID